MVRLCIFFLSAVLLFPLGAYADAEGPADENARREFMYSFGNPDPAKGEDAFTRYFYNSAGKNALTITLPKYDSIADTGIVWGSYAVEYRSGGTDAAFGRSPGPADDGASRSDSEAGHADIVTDVSTASRSEDAPHVYALDDPFDRKVLDEIGYTGRDDNDGSFVFAEDNSDASAGARLSDGGAYSILVFEKKAFHNSQNRAGISFDEYYGRDTEEEDYSASPYAIPIAMLVLMLGFGIVLAMHTTAGGQLDD